jgi:hypothetical protein
MKAITERASQSAGSKSSLAAKIAGAASVLLGLVREQGSGSFRWRTRIEWRRPRLRREWVKYPRLVTPLRPMSEASAQTPAIWRAGEQSDNLETRKA